jgi:hypothetical protein
MTVFAMLLRLSWLRADVADCTCSCYEAAVAQKMSSSSTYSQWFWACACESSKGSKRIQEGPRIQQVSKSTRVDTHTSLASGLRQLMHCVEWIKVQCCRALGFRTGCLSSALNCVHKCSLVFSMCSQAGIELVLMFYGSVAVSVSAVARVLFSSEKRANMLVMLLLLLTCVLDVHTTVVLCI